MTQPRLTRRAVCLGLPLGLAACGAAEPVWAPQSEVDKVRYRHPGPPQITLFTMKNRGSGKGAHTGLMVSARERVIFDPAGTFQGEGIVERNDVVFGATPLIEEYYVSYHARKTYFVRRADAVVPESVASQALALVIGYGPVAKTQCSRSTSAILQQLPGFEYIRSVLWPDDLLEQFLQYPGTTTEDFYEDDSDDKTIAQAAWDRAQLRTRAVR